MSSLAHLLYIFYFINGKSRKLEETKLFTENVKNVVKYYSDFSSKSCSWELSTSPLSSSPFLPFSLLLSIFHSHHHQHYHHRHQKNFPGHLQGIILSLSLLFCIDILLEVSGDNNFYSIWKQNQSLLLRKKTLRNSSWVVYYENSCLFISILFLYFANNFLSFTKKGTTFASSKFHRYPLIF